MMWVNAHFPGVPLRRCYERVADTREKLVFTDFTEPDDPGQSVSIITLQKQDLNSHTPYLLLSS